MNTSRLQLLLCMSVAAATLTLAPGTEAAEPTTAASDAQQIRDAAMAVLDARRPFDPKSLDSIVVQSDLERQFATEMLRAMRAEVSMFRRAAVAVGGAEDSEPVRRADETAAATEQAIAAAEPVISREDATMPFAPGGGRGTTLFFQKVQGRWQFDFLRRYRERQQIDEAGIARWRGRQRAAELAAGIYERKEEHDLSVLPLLYETMAEKLAAAAAKRISTTSTTRPRR